MSYLAEAHAEWHAVNGQFNPDCPLDCGAMSPEQRAAEDALDAIDYYDEVGTASIRCAHCKGTHRAVAAVAACASLAA